MTGKGAATAFALLLAAAAVTTIAGVLAGQLGFAVVFVFPVIYGSGLFAAVAVILIFAAFVMLFSMSFTGYRKDETGYFFEHQSASRAPAVDQEESQEKKAAPGRAGRTGGVIFIGPVPIIFGTDAKILRYMFAAAGIMVALILVLLLFSII